MIDYKEIRIALHEHPQTAGNEQYAHDLIVAHLQTLHPTKVYTHVAGFGVIAVWQNGDASPFIAFRADTDALSIGHRCGHDGHTTILLRLADIIDEHAPHANILLLWQPAEETGEGARAIIGTGILQQYDIQAFYALHNIPGYPLGTVVLSPHTFAAASTGIIFHLHGRPTHASTPEKGINPGLAVSEIIQRFHALQECNVEFVQSTLICVRLGTPAFGTSAGDAEIMFTLRAFTNSAMQQLLADARAIAGEVAAKSSLELSVMLQEPFGATENVCACVDEIEKAAAMLSLPVTYCHEPFRWSEDFGEFMRIFPGAMFGIGSGEKHPELHHPDYDFPDDLTVSAAKLFFQLVKSFQFFSPA